MYKDKSKERLASKARMQKMRKGVTKGVTSAQGVTEAPRVEGVTKVRGVTIPEFARVLPELTINNVLAVLHNRRVKGLLDDSEGRWERAVTWHDWDRRGRPVGG